MNPLVAQVIGRVPNITPEQLSALVATDLTHLAQAEEAAEATQGFTATQQLSSVHYSVEFEVFAVARLAVLGILSEDMSLTKPWTDAVGAFDMTGQTFVAADTVHSVEPAAEIVVPLDTPTDTIPPVSGEVPAQSADFVDTPLDIPEGNI